MGRWGGATNQAGSQIKSVLCTLWPVTERAPPLGAPVIIAIVETNTTPAIAAKDVTDFASRAGIAYLQQTCPALRVDLAQYFTSPDVARFMARMVSLNSNGIHIADAGAGSGILASAVAEELASRGQVEHIHVTAYEIDHGLHPVLSTVFSALQDHLRGSSITFDWEIRGDDFVIDAVQHRYNPTYDLVIMNPPYFKISRDDQRAQAWPEYCHGQPNIYALFMAAGAEILKPGGQQITISPRSFASGTYFRNFRQMFFEKMTLNRLHIFNSRDKAFKQDGVLQENVILSTFRKPVHSSCVVTISSSQGINDLQESEFCSVVVADILDRSSQEQVLSMPVNLEDIEFLRRFRGHNYTLQTLGFSVTTGPVVAFRAAEHLTDRGGKNSVPLLWLQHVQKMRIDWPSKHFTKPQRLLINSNTNKLLTPPGNYVVIRRFSSKDDKARVIAAPLLVKHFKDQSIALENHLNLIRPLEGKMSKELAVGLAAFLNSSDMEKYIRIVNGSTQINASELLALPMPCKSELLKWASIKARRSVSVETCLHGGGSKLNGKA